MNTGRGPRKKAASFAAMTEGERRRMASRERRRSPLAWMWVVGGIGWIVIVPMVLFTAGGVWLDERLPAGFSWTITFLFLGTVAGCFLAWRWVARVPKK